MIYSIRSKNYTGKIMNRTALMVVFSLTLLLIGCGGGGGSTGANPNQPNLVSTAGDKLIIPMGAFREYRVTGGVPPYQVSSSEPSVVTGSIASNALSIGAIAGGIGTIRVFDTKGTSVSTEVTVGSSIPLFTTAPATLLIGVNVPRTFQIGGGSPPYSVEGGSASVAVVTQVDATHWSAVGKAIGGAIDVKIRDSAGAVIIVALSTAAPELRISPDKLTMPTGYEGEIQVTGGQPPYYPGGGIPAAIQVTPSVSQDGKFKVQGSIASVLDVSFVDSAGQSVKVEVTINVATVSFRMSPSPIFISENGNESINLSIFGFYGDTNTGSSSGVVCIYSSDPSYLLLDTTRTQCSTFSPNSRSFTLTTGIRGDRCISADKVIQIQAIDSKQQIATGTINIINNGSGCNATSGALTTTPSVVSVNAATALIGATSNTVFVRGGTGSYTVTSSNPGLAIATVDGDIVTVTGTDTVGASGVATITVLDKGSGQTTNFTVNVI